MNKSTDHKDWKSDESPKLLGKWMIVQHQHLFGQQVLKGVI